MASRKLPNKFAWTPKDVVVERRDSLGILKEVAVKDAKETTEENFQDDS